MAIDPEVEGKYFAHKGLISRVDDHSLVKVTHVLNEVSPSIINGEGRLGKAVWEFGLINPARER